VAQAHGRFRDVAAILAGFLQLHFSVLSLSLGHVACSHLLGNSHFQSLSRKKECKSQ
jgi:hypothetical protein